MKIEGEFEKLEKLEELEKRISRLEVFLVSNRNSELIADAIEDLGHKIEELEERITDLEATVEILGRVFDEASETANHNQELFIKQINALYELLDRQRNAIFIVAKGGNDSEVFEELYM